MLTLSTDPRYTLLVGAKDEVHALAAEASKYANAFLTPVQLRSISLEHFVSMQRIIASRISHCRVSYRFVSYRIVSYFRIV